MGQKLVKNVYLIYYTFACIFLILAVILDALNSPAISLTLWTAFILFSIIYTKTQTKKLARAKRSIHFYSITNRNEALTLLRQQQTMRKSYPIMMAVMMCLFLFVAKASLFGIYFYIIIFVMIIAGSLGIVDLIFLKKLETLVKNHFDQVSTK